MPHPSLTVPDNVSFEQAIAITQEFLSLLDAKELSELEIETTVGELVGSENGARGFFVVYLTDDRPLADRPSPGVIGALQMSPEIVSELLVKNVAMSSAMAMTHERNNNSEMASNSKRVTSRCHALIEQIQLSEVSEKAKLLHESAKTRAGTYETFLKRWNYDEEQRNVIQTAIASII
ncbi:hypothetical protein [Roseofilum casamattae]|uniref:Uncharacterized protein n=1 Tax=Roseofilum casamattae BLCC-M143 TaxID=3022442 RepID=A0ABT7BY20_9CYAN|nr:hypothetical protein [Roseofilum casamattae]MDJ1183965.1 hypothetical protein [Roseofilum casamattae BLCC-M143]